MWLDAFKLRVHHVFSSASDIREFCSNSTFPFTLYWTPQRIEKSKSNGFVSGCQAPSMKDVEIGHGVLRFNAVASNTVVEEKHTILVSVECNDHNTEIWNTDLEVSISFLFLSFFLCTNVDKI